MDYLPWYVVYGSLVGLLVASLTAAAAAGYMGWTKNGEKGRRGPVIKGLMLGALAGFLLSDCVGMVAMKEATEGPRNSVKSDEECLAKSKAAFVASTSLRHRRSALNQIQFVNQHQCRNTQQTVETRAAAIELAGGSDACDQLGYLYRSYQWFSRLEELSEECGHRFSRAEALRVRLALGDFEGASDLAESHKAKAGGELEVEDFVRHSRIHVAAGRYGRAQRSLETALERNSEMDGERQAYSGSYTRRFRCALVGLKASQGDVTPLLEWDDSDEEGWSCRRYFADLAGDSDVEALLNAAFDGRRSVSTSNLGVLFWDRSLERLYDVFFEELLQRLVGRQNLTAEQRWRRANLYMGRAVFDLSLEKLDAAWDHAEGARADMDSLLEVDEAEEELDDHEFYRQSFRIDQIKSVIALRKGDLQAAREYLESAMEQARSPSLTISPNNPSILRFGTTQYGDILSMLDSGEMDNLESIGDWINSQFNEELMEALFQGLLDDDADTIIDALERWEFSTVRPGIEALIVVFLSDPEVVELGRYLRWNISFYETHFYSRTMENALTDLQAALRLARIIEDRDWIEQLEPIVERNHEVYFDLNRYRILSLLEIDTSGLRFAWTRP